MFDICIETFRAIIVGVIVLILFFSRKKAGLLKVKGGRYIFTGFVLILIGTVIDITDNFSNLNTYIVIGHTEYEAFIEKIIGYLLGFVFLAYGIWLWIPDIIAMRNRREKGLLEAETEKAISNLLKTSLLNCNIRDQLVNILDILTKISWFEVLPQGAIFLSNANDELVMVANHNLASELVVKCEKINIGDCLCGLAAKNKELIFRNCITEEHTISFPNIQPHGHYNIPLVHNNKLLGVIVLYVSHGHIPHANESTFMKMLGDTVALIIAKKTLEENIKIIHAEAEELRTETIGRLLSAAEFRDTETGLHIKRMTEYASAIGKHVGLTKEQLTLLRLGAPMHDIGKVGISDAILLKPGKLTSDEFSEMKKHTTIGAELLKGREETFRSAYDIALTHHEKWDGTGYPGGLKGNNIPLFGRICAVADVFDALTSKRPYKKAWSAEQAFDFIIEQRGTQFDPVMSDALVQCKKTVMHIHTIYKEGTDNSKEQLVHGNEQTLQGWLSWDDNLSIGIDRIDMQHKYLVSITNELYNEVIIGNEGSAILSIIKKLINYADIHFSAEEEIMLDHNYPYLEKHQEYHRDFINKIDSYRKAIKEFPLVVSKDIVIFLRDWFDEHIRNEDAKIYEYVLLADANYQCNTSVQRREAV